MVRRLESGSFRTGQAPAAPRGSAPEIIMTLPFLPTGVVGCVAAAVLAYTTLVWLLSLALRDSSIMDVAWGPGFLVAAGAAAVALGAWGGRGAWVLALTVVWGFRLGGHILAVAIGRGGEDARYAKWRREAGRSWWWRSYFKVFLLQGVILCVVALPLVVQVAAGGPDVPTAWDAAGLAVWLAGFLVESAADRQMLRFRRANPAKGAVMDRGLWRWSRHPNYFGETLVWWGFGLMALSVPGGWVALAGPLLITWLILEVSGVAMLERSLAEAKPGYADYARRTSAFIPWKPRD
jgi:steroid 5-alpha reductase family enzyme